MKIFNPAPRQLHLTLASLLIATSAWAQLSHQNPNIPSATSATDKASQLARAAQEAGQLPGLQAAVLKDGELIWSVALGFANIEHEVPLTTRSRMRIGSVSKTLTSAAIGLLLDSNQLDLDAPAATYLPNLPETLRLLTSRQLGGHLSGVPHYQALDIVNTKHYGSVIQALNKFKDKELLFEPGDRFEYSSYGWNLVGAIIQSSSHQPFLEYMQEHVFEAMQLNDTLPDKTKQLIPRRAQTYTVTSKRSFNTPTIDQSDAWPSAGFLSSAEDLVRFADHMWHGEFIKKSTIQLLSTSQRTTAGESTGYGIGWQDQTMGNREWSGHGGSHVGATADLWIQPEAKVVIALITNTNTGVHHDLLEELARLFVPSG